MWTRVALATLGAVVSAVAAEGTVAADTLRRYELPVVTVTTTRAEAGKSAVPFTTVEPADIQLRYTAQDLPTLLNTLPSVFVWSQNGNQIGYSTLVMRGFDQRRIAVLINGVPQNDPEDHNVYWIDFPDLAASVSDIQVQRGAGLVSYGAAAIGGSINITTLNFLQQRLVRISLGNGWQQFGAGGRTVLQPTVQRYALEVSSGLIEGRYAVYGRMARIDSWGYRDQSWAQLNSYFLSGVRFDERLTTQVNIFGGPLADGLTYYGIPKEHIRDRTLRRKNYAWWEYDTTYRQIGFALERRPNELENFSQPHYELLNDWRISDSLELKSVLFYYTGDGFFDFDGSWADARTLRLTPEYGWDLPDTVYPRNAIIRAFVGNKHGGWIPRLLWRHRGGELLLGAEVRLHRSEHWGKVRYAELLPTNFDPEYKIYSYEGVRDIFSLFARERYELTPQLALTAEAQVVHHSYRIRRERAGNRWTYYLTTRGDTVWGSGTLFDVRYTFFNPRLGLLWRPTPEQELFALVAYTSREPRMRNLYAAEDSYFGAGAAGLPAIPSVESGATISPVPWSSPSGCWILSWDCGGAPSAFASRQAPSGWSSSTSWSRADGWISSAPQLTGMRHGRAILGWSWKPVPRSCAVQRWANSRWEQPQRSAATESWSTPTTPSAIASRLPAIRWRGSRRCSPPGLCATVSARHRYRCCCATSVASIRTTSAPSSPNTHSATRR
jgi:iron complex outermembrane receptor protein